MKIQSFFQLSFLMSLLVTVNFIRNPIPKQPRLFWSEKSVQESQLKTQTSFPWTSRASQSILQITLRNIPFAYENPISYFIGVDILIRNCSFRNGFVNYGVYIKSSNFFLSIVDSKFEVDTECDPTLCNKPSIIRVENDNSDILVQNCLFVNYVPTS